MSKKKANDLGKLGLKSKEYFLVTAHRDENLDNPERLGEGLRLVGEEFSLPVIFPMHPRTRKMVQ
ncbi:MAG: UDP-N-acetylglucosamine 2-epimerase [Methanothrix sp.]|nr:UDP-N-acetylglucosamine 2-epimerase [Methanothrix sp.]MDD4448410.1 UDP-N-acetylglucosamine 2-epimerase [Methanothrix sp.]